MAFNKNPSKAEDIVNYQQSNQDNRYVVSNYANASKQKALRPRSSYVRSKFPGTPSHNKPKKDIKISANLLGLGQRKSISNNDLIMNAIKTTNLSKSTKN